MILSMIAAMNSDGLIGKDGGMPWHLPADLKRFRRLTMGKPIIMGRATWESIGRPLDGRRNIVLTRQEGYHAEGGCVAHSLVEALFLALQSGADEAFVIGGGEIFRQTLPLIDRLYLTLVEGEFSGDTYFPRVSLDSPDWTTLDEESHPADETNPYPYRFRTLQRQRRAE